MERRSILLGVRQRDIVFPPSFNTQEKNKQVGTKYSLKMEDEELQEVLLCTLQATNSTRYRHLVDELFSQEASRVSVFSFFLDPLESKHGGQKKSTHFERSASDW